MATNDDGSGVAGPTLYLESDDLDPTEAFCTEVLDGEVGSADEGEYRVVQLTSSRSFDSLRDALDAQLERIRDPSAAAVIITTPQADEESAVGEVGDDTPLYGFRVDPQDLTGISIAFSRLLENWEATEGTVKICLRDVESLFPYHETDLLYRFLNTVLATLQGAGAEVHTHIRPSATDEQTLQMFKSLFARVVEREADDPGPEPAGDGPTTERSAADPAPEPADTPAPATASSDTDAASGTVSTATMTADEVDAFLASEGYGVLAFDGDSPYAVPMSYGYDADERVFYMHMSSFEGSEKQARLDDSTAVSLVVSRYARPDRWRSVVVDGSLSRLSGDAVRERDVLEVFASSELASVDVFSRDLSTVSFDWYVLTPSEISGRRSAGSL